MKWQSMKLQSLTAMAVLGSLGLLTPAKADDRQERLARLRAAKIDSRKLQEFVVHYRSVNRDALQAEGLLGCLAPEPGGPMIRREHRSVHGERLLLEAKDLLFALLFGDAQSSVHFERTERELLTLVVPRAKANALEFLQASPPEPGKTPPTKPTTPAPRTSSSKSNTAKPLTK